MSKISVIMSVYNAEKYLDQSINSILEQSYKYFEFIIIDDGSTDGSWNIIKYFSSKDKRIQAVKQKNIGLTKSLNRAIKISKGEFIARQDADDFSHKDRFLKQIKWFQKSHDRVLCGTYAYKQKKKFLEKIYFPPTVHYKIIKCLKFKNVFNHSSVMFKSLIKNQIILYNENLKFAQDYELWSRLSEVGLSGNINEPLVFLSQDQNSISIKKREEQRYTAIIIALLNNFNELQDLIKKRIEPKSLIEVLYLNEKYKDMIEVLLFIYDLSIKRFKPNNINLIKNNKEILLKNFNQIKYNVIRNIFG
jgi:glycosyltransferase involved in cell wall biosynthesis